MDQKDANDRDMISRPFDYVQRMKAKGRTVKPQAPHTGSKSGHNWEPDEAAKARLGDAYGIIKEIIEEP
jgi:hypothetical protein